MVTSFEVTEVDLVREEVGNLQPRHLPRNFTRQLHGADRTLVAMLAELSGLSLICRPISSGQDGARSARP
jgi:hypothetical protein